MKKFKKFYIEITNVCNLECDFCPRTKRKAECMNIETFTKILDQIKEYTDFIYFHVKGEPLLHPDLEHFLDISYKKGFQVNITTNGTLINKVRDMLLTKPALRQINFSLHSFDGNEGLVDKELYLQNILSFAKEAMEHSKVITALRIWNLDEKQTNHLEDAKNFDILEAIEKEFDLSYRLQDKIAVDRGIQISDRIFLNHDFQFQWPDLKEQEDDGSGFCYCLRTQVAILSDGTVVPCCLDGEGIINLGNINTTDFSEIINTDRARAIVDGFSNRHAVEELCRKCGYRRRFGS